MSGIFETLSGAGGLRAEGKSAQNIANFNAAVAEQQAKAEREKAAFASKRQAKKAAEIEAGLTAKIAKAGGLGSPVAADLAAEQAAELELEQLLIAFEGEVLAGKAETQAELDRLQGRLLKQRGKSAARRANVQFGMQAGMLAAPFLTGFKFPGSTKTKLISGSPARPAGFGFGRIA